MSKTISLLKEMINENKITMQEVLEACGYEVETIYRDNIVLCDNIEIEFGYDEQIISIKEFR